MPSTVKNYFDFNAAYKTIGSYTSSAYNKSVTWITSNFNTAYSKLPDIRSIAKRHTVNTFNSGKTFLWTNKAWILGGAAITLALMILHRYWKNRPRRLIVETAASTLHVFKVVIRIPKENPIPPNVTLTFCIDKSQSMKNEIVIDKTTNQPVLDEHGNQVIAGSEKEAKEALIKLLNNAQEKVDQLGAQISIALSTFDGFQQIISEPIKLIPSKTKLKGKEERPIDTLKKAVNDYISDGATTRIVGGLEKATEQLEQMAKTNPTASHAVIVLTDGEEDHLIQKEKELRDLNQRQVRVNAHQYLIGTGNYKPATLEFIKSIIKNTKIINAKGGDGNDTIDSAMTRIFKETVVSYKNLELTTSHPQLTPGTWSVIDKPMEGGTCKLGSLPSDESLTIFVQIHGEKLKKPLELEEVRFTLKSTDANNRDAFTTVWWNPNTTIDPKLLQEARVRT